jgi:hypothetical protein
LDESGLWTHPAQKATKNMSLLLLIHVIIFCPSLLFLSGLADHAAC